MAVAQNPNPIVTMDFYADGLPELGLDADPTYVYHVQTTADTEENFLRLYVYAAVWAEEEIGGEWIPLWTQLGPVVDGIDQGWDASYSIENEYGGDTAEWRATTGLEVEAHTVWAGDFILVAPNSAPVLGLIQVGGPADGMYDYALDVPGAAPLPEPSSLLALGSLTAMAGSMIRRRNR